ncbi:MAG: type IV pilus assembly protein PilM [Candidatus Omnitrophica bacterium]|nr:type IV pilus assembly protein PilM [Candidatus Omnitrophota bacterium]
MVKPKFFTRKKSVIGLDIGTAAIKLAKFVHAEGKLQLSQLVLKEINLEKDTPVAQLEALKELFKSINAQESDINVVVNCAQSCTRVITIPYMPKAEIIPALKWEMKDFISFPVDESVLDFKVLEEVSESGAKKLKILVACSPQATINNYISLLGQLGLKPHLFTQAGFVLDDVIAGLGSEGQKTTAILDIGHSLSELFIFQKGKAAFSRKLPVAAREFTKAMTQVLASELGKIQLNFAQAEKIKRKYGIPESATSQVLEGKLTSMQLLSLLRPNVEKLIEEIERSFDFYRESEQGIKVERLILLGGGSDLKGLAKQLNENLGIPVELGNPFIDVSSLAPYLLENNATQAHRFAQAIGVAQSAKDSINLLPVEIKEETKILIERSSIKALMAAVFVILILSYVGMRIKLGTDLKRLAAAELELGALKPRIGQVNKQAFLVDALNKRIYWSDVLKEIGNCVPEQIRLTKMKAAQNSVQLAGEIKPSKTSEEKLLTECMKTLEKGIFEEVKLVTTKNATAQGLYQFELKLSLK